ncbi:hypothetical protein BC936DRAFT_140757 [Jimgerdemannia flammicorona]|uniref:Uncharacterized protein n=1 Tax=Jimgerdemannia flammicorona TaxID=994334 RepID=A0A433DGT6_9FUNG|nr:hypothetical protein BC936DRAFT_140757 [Jimgerdemannia flammicorona]
MFQYIHSNLQCIHLDLDSCNRITCRTKDLTAYEKTNETCKRCGKRYTRYPEHWAAARTAVKLSKTLLNTVTHVLAEV